MSVFPPLAYPSTVSLLDAAFLKPSTHESNLLSCVHGVDIGFGAQCSTQSICFIRPFPCFEGTAADELLAAQRNCGERFYTDDLIVDEVIHMRPGGSQFLCDFAHSQNIVDRCL